MSVQDSVSVLKFEKSLPVIDSSLENGNVSNVNIQPISSTTRYIPPLIPLSPPNIVSVSQLSQEIDLGVKYKTEGIFFLFVYKN